MKQCSMGVLLENHADWEAWHDENVEESLCLISFSKTGIQEEPVSYPCIVFIESPDTGRVIYPHDIREAVGLVGIAVELDAEMKDLLLEARGALETIVIKVEDDIRAEPRNTWYRTLHAGTVKLQSRLWDAASRMGQPEGEKAEATDE